MILYTGHKVANMNLEGDFILVDTLCIIYWILNLRETICKFRVKLKYYNLTLMSTHYPTEEKDERTKDEFYSSLEKVCDAVPNYDIKFGKKSYLYPACGGHSL